MKETTSSKFVVYLQKLNRTQPGIHQRQAIIRGDTAFVYHADSRTADIVPSANVFENLNDAKSYFAGLGKVMWVVLQDGPRYKKNVPEMFQGRVIFRVNTNRDAFERYETIVQTLEGKLIEKVPYDAKFFKTKREAESHFAHVWRSIYKDARREMSAWQKLIDALMKNRPRARR
jgi:hypothetical protein